MTSADGEDPLILAYRTFSLPRCDVIVGMLKAYGIEAHAFDREFNGNNSHLLVATGGYRIMVRQSRVYDVRMLLKPFRDEVDHPESAAFKKQPITNGVLLLLGLYFGVWIPAWLRKRER